MLENRESTVRDFKIRSTDDGIHLEGSILWLDAHKTGDLSFLSTPATQKKFTGPQFIATEETVKILQINRKNPKALICQYNHPFALGKLEIELLPSGSSLGSALLYIKANNKEILYAPTLQTQKINIVRKIQLRKADTLILEAFHPNPSKTLPSRKKEKERLLDNLKLELSKGHCPHVYCNPTITAQEITELLCGQNIPVTVHPYIYKVNKIYENSGSQLGPYQSKTITDKPHVKIFPHPFKKPPSRGQTEAPFFVIDEKMDENLCDFNCLDDPTLNRYVLSPVCDLRDLKEVIQFVEPKEIFVFGPYAKRYVEDLTHLALSVKVLNPNDQPSLF